MRRPDLPADAGAWLPARPGTRCGSARGSVSGVCPETSRRSAGIRVAPAPAVLTRMIISDVSPANLAGRSLGCPALFGERDHDRGSYVAPRISHSGPSRGRKDLVVGGRRSVGLRGGAGPMRVHLPTLHVSAAQRPPARAERRRPTSDPFRSVGGRRLTSRASDTPPWAHVGKQGHHARAGRGRALSPRFVDPPEVREADTLHDPRRDVPLARLAIARRLAMPVGTRCMSNLPGLILIAVIVAAVVTLAAFGIHALWTAATSWWRR